MRKARRIENFFVQLFLSRGTRLETGCIGDILRKLSLNCVINHKIPDRILPVPVIRWKVFFQMPGSFSNQNKFAITSGGICPIQIVSFFNPVLTCCLFRSCLLFNHKKRLTSYSEERWTLTCRTCRQGSQRPNSKMSSWYVHF